MKKQYSPAGRWASFRYWGGDGFTLTEVLVTIAVIIALLALVIPSMSKMREKTAEIKCLSNQKQLYLAVQAYAMDYNNRIVYARKPGKSVGEKIFHWHTELTIKGYLGRPAVTGANEGLYPATFPVLTCPARNMYRRERAPQSITSGQVYSYGFNLLINNAELANGAKYFTQLEQPGKTLLIGDTNWNSAATLIWISDNATYPPGPEHYNRTANLLFADGHIESRTPDSIPHIDTDEGKIFWWGGVNLQPR